MSGPAWFCEAHQVWTTSDCPRCDDELETMSAPFTEWPVGP